jgi:hypothetical protein
MAAIEFEAVLTPTLFHCRGTADKQLDNHWGRQQAVYRFNLLEDF